MTWFLKSCQEFSSC